MFLRYAIEVHPERRGVRSGLPGSEAKPGDPHKPGEVRAAVRRVLAGTLAVGATGPRRW
jgi:hypothetical protein